jgi:hypothetical protein
MVPRNSWLSPLLQVPRTLQEKRRVWNAINYQRNRDAILNKKKKGRK